MSFISARANDWEFFYGKNLYGRLGWRGLPNQGFLGARISIGDQGRTALMTTTTSLIPAYLDNPRMVCAEKLTRVFISDYRKEVGRQYN